MRQDYWRQKEIFEVKVKWAFFRWFSPLSVNWPESATCPPTSWPSPAIWSVLHPRAGPLDTFGADGLAKDSILVQGQGACEWVGWVGLG